MTRFKKIISGILLLPLLGGAGCGTNGQSSGRQRPVEVSPTLTIDGIKLNVEIVQDAESRQKGLMNRDELEKNEGMLFVFNSTRVLSFWMRNTFIPLDIAFVTETGRIVDIQHMAPLDDTTSYVSSAPALYALEVNAGWFSENGIKVGGQVEF